MPIKNKICPVRKCPWSAQLNNELRFLIASCQIDPSTDDIEFINSYLNDPHLDINTLIGLANQHGILPLVYKTLKKLLQSDSASDINYGVLLADLKSAYTQIAQRNMLMSAELIRIMKLLEENDINALAFKGPALSQLAYGDITLRQYVDLDILVKRKDIYTIDKLLKDKSYQRVYALSTSQEKVWIKHAKDIGFYHPKSNVHLEMHWALLENDYPMQLDLDDIWKNKQEIDINGKKIKTFGTEDLLLYLCIHGSIHLYERIEWVKDIDLLVQSQDIDWEIVNQKVNDSGFKTMFYLGLHLSNTLFKTKLPKFILEHISQEKKLVTITTYILNSWQSQTLDTMNGIIQQAHIKLKLFPGFKEKINYLHKIILKPTFNEYWFVDLPKGLYWGYYLVRPYLLLKKYFSKST